VTVTLFLWQNLGVRKLHPPLVDVQYLKPLLLASLLLEDLPRRSIFPAPESVHMVVHSFSSSALLYPSACFIFFFFWGGRNSDNMVVLEAVYSKP